MSLAIVHFFAQKSKPESLLFQGYFLFGFTLICPDGGPDCEAFHKPFEFFLGQGHGFIASSRPLVDTVKNLFHDHAPAIPVFSE